MTMVNRASRIVPFVMMAALAGLAVFVALSSHGCGPEGRIVAHRVLCATPAVLHVADKLALGLDDNDAGWNAAIGLADAIGSTIAQIGCDLTADAATHLLADMDRQVASSGGFHPAARECHRAARQRDRARDRLLSLKGQRP